MNEEMNYLKEKQKMSIALIASCAVEVLALLGVAFGVFEETAFYLTEIIAVIANLGLIVIPIEVLLWIRLLYLSELCWPFRSPASLFLRFHRGSILRKRFRTDHEKLQRMGNIMSWSESRGFG